MNQRRSTGISTILPTLFGISMLLMGDMCARAAVTTASRMKTQLNQVENKMGELQHTLTNAETTRRGLYQALAVTEKQMGEHIHTLHTVRQDITNKQQAVISMQHAVDKNQQQLQTQQQALANHVRARYQIGNIQPLQWLLNQDNPQTMSRLLTYYQYVVQADQHLIQQIRETTDTLAENQNKLHAEFVTLQQLQQTLLYRQKRLAEVKRQHHTVIQSLSESIQTKQQALADYRRDQAHLQTLLVKLSHPLPTRLPPQTMPSAIRFNAKFSNPLKTNPQRAQKLNQGMIFFAPRGTPVSAVLPGKVVFSDWLNGYGLLLIIDHGQGTMSLYAHNESLFKSKGASVKQGDQIAIVGHSGGLRENGLYFELRRRGKAIPPRQWLS